MKAYSFFLLLITTLSTSQLTATDRFPRVSNGTYTEECGSCHMAFQPQLLPERSWTALMLRLDDHFGENVSLGLEKSDEIEQYLKDNAADRKNSGTKILRGLSKSNTPLRISELPYWIHEHKEDVSPAQWRQKRVGSKANCRACHRQADAGNYDD